jgi:hypothetical protein
MADPISEHGLGQTKGLKPTHAKTPKPTRTVLPKPPKRRVSLNPMQQARLNVNRMLAPQYSAVDQEAQRQNQAIQAYTTAVMQQLAGLAPRIGADYDNAINSQAALSQGAADALRAVNPSGDVARLLDSIGAPQAQTSQIQGNLNNTFNGGAAVGNYLAGVSPEAVLRAQGQAAQTLASLQPGFTALAGKQALQSALAQQSDARAKIASQVPSMLQDQLNTFASNKAKRQQLALEYQTLGLKQQNQTFNQNAKTASLRLQQDKFIAQQQKQIKDGTRIDASASRAAGYMIDKNGNPILKNGKRQILPGFNTKNGRVVKAKKPTAAQQKAAASAFPNLTKTQVQHLRSGIAAVFYGVKPDANGKGGLPAGNYQQAITEAVKAGYSRAAAIKMANRFYKPGKRGRPAKGNDLSGLGLVVPPLVQ